MTNAGSELVEHVPDGPVVALRRDLRRNALRRSRVLAQVHGCLSQDTSLILQVSRKLLMRKQPRRTHDEASTVVNEDAVLLLC